MRRQRHDIAMLGSSILKRIENGESPSAVAKDLGLTRAQLRYRIRVFKEQEQAGVVQEVNDESWTRTWQTNRLELLVKDPTTLFAYWEVDELRKSLISRHFQFDYTQLPFCLQLYDVTDIDFDGYNAHSVRKIDVFPDSDNWYIHNVEPRRRYLVDFGTLTFHGAFFAILRSNVVETPPLRTYRESSLHAQFGALHVNTHTDAAQLPASGQVSEGAGLSLGAHVPYEDTFDGYSVNAQTRGR